MSAVNIVRTNIHSVRGIKPGTNTLNLNDKSKAALRDKLKMNFLWYLVIYGKIFIQTREKY